MLHSALDGVIWMGKDPMQDHVAFTNLAIVAQLLWFSVLLLDLDSSYARLRKSHISYKLFQSSSANAIIKEQNYKTLT
jgi:hypothetical protein